MRQKHGPTRYRASSPRPGAIIWPGAFTSKYNHAWYVRAPGETLMRAVPKGREFAPFVAALLADAPELATAVQAKTDGYQHDDLPQVLDRYNKAMPAGRWHVPPRNRTRTQAGLCGATGVSGRL